MLVGLNLLPFRNSGHKIALAPAEGKANFSCSLLPQALLPPCDEVISGDTKLCTLVRFFTKTHFSLCPLFSLIALHPVSSSLPVGKPQNFSLNKTEAVTLHPVLKEGPD